MRTLPPWLEHVVLGGEPIRKDALIPLGPGNPSCRYMNSYGPTEATDVVSVIAGDEPGAAAIELVIGRPLSNTQFYILDAALGPVPIGVGGELCIGGVGVGRGYVGRPDLTAEGFVPDPFSTPNLARAYIAQVISAVPRPMDVSNCSAASTGR